jgi:hypothetical protein
MASLERSDSASSSSAAAAAASSPSASSPKFITQDDFEKLKGDGKKTKAEKKKDKADKKAAEKKAEREEKERKCLTAVRAKLAATKTGVVNQRIKEAVRAGIEPLQIGADDAPLTLPDFVSSDFDVTRFIRARRADADKTYEMILNHIVWRATYRPELITVDSFRRELEAGKGFPIGPDRGGHMTWLIMPGRHNPKQIDNDEVMRALIYYIESSLKNLPPGVTELNLMIDFEGWSPSKNVDHNLDKMMFDMIQNHYPERLNAAYAINTPAVFKVAWTVIRPWIDKRSQKKIRVLPHDRYKEELAKDFDLSVLPIKYGGTNDIDLSPGKSFLGDTGPKGLKMQR